MREDIIMALQEMEYLSDNDKLMEDDMLRAVYSLICDHRQLISIHNTIKEAVNHALEVYNEN